MALIAVGTFFAQATATGFVGRAATTDRGSASGIYLACYFFGGLVGSAVLGQVFDLFGWAACVAGIGVALALAALLAIRLRTPAPAIR
jgi:predicted MFS family arabinose efflux permease